MEVGDIFGFNKYYVKCESKKFYGIYDNWNTLITHKETKKQALKLCKHIDEAYLRGYQDCREIYDENAWRN